MEEMLFKTTIALAISNLQHYKKCHYVQSQQHPVHQMLETWKKKKLYIGELLVFTHPLTTYVKKYLRKQNLKFLNAD